MNRLNPYYSIACIIGAITAWYLCVYATNTGIRVVSAFLLAGMALSLVLINLIDEWRDR